MTNESTSERNVTRDCNKNTVASLGPSTNSVGRDSVAFSRPLPLVGEGGWASSINASRTKRFLTGDSSLNLSRTKIDRLSPLLSPSLPLFFLLVKRHVEHELQQIGSMLAFILRI